MDSTKGQEYRLPGPVIPTVCALRKIEHERRKVKVVMVIDTAVRFNNAFRQRPLSISEVAIGFIPPTLTDQHSYLPTFLHNIRNSHQRGPRNP
jgi:hypothetical protein